MKGVIQNAVRSYPLLVVLASFLTLFDLTQDPPPGAER